MLELLIIPSQSGLTDSHASVPGVEIVLNVLEKVKRVYQIPDGKKVKFLRIGNKIRINVPTFTMHSGIVLEY
jgi:hypothetical protein